MFALTLLLALIVVAVGAPIAGVDTTDRFDSPEWQRRRTWRSTSNR